MLSQHLPAEVPPHRPLVQALSRPLGCPPSQGITEKVAFPAALLPGTSIVAAPQPGSHLQVSRGKGWIPVSTPPKRVGALVQLLCYIWIAPFEQGGFGITHGSAGSSQDEMLPFLFASHSPPPSYSHVYLLAWGGWEDMNIGRWKKQCQLSTSLNGFLPLKPWSSLRWLLGIVFMRTKLAITV